MSSGGPPSGSAGDMPFLVLERENAYEHCQLLNLFKTAVRNLPRSVVAFLEQSLVDPYFTRIRQCAGESAAIPRTRRLVLIYQCIRLCDRSAVPFVIAAISLVTGLPPSVILDHNRIRLNPLHMKIIQAFHEKAATPNFEPVSTFSGRIEVTEKLESLPSTLAWNFDDNPFTRIDVPTCVCEFGQSSEGKVLPVLKPYELPEDMDVRARWLLSPPSIRKSLRSPFFFSPDLSDGFNPAHGLPPVPCCNEVDDQRPPALNWIADLTLPSTIPETYERCQCADGDCCACHVMTVDGHRTMQYTSDGLLNIGELSHCRPLIVECNRECKCDPMKCRNRVMQNRSQIRLMIARAPTKSGWGVWSTEFIPKGAFVCEYLGSVINDPLIAEVIGREYDKNLESYLFDLDAFGVSDDEMLTVDPSHVGNVSKYINHSCDPNLVAISVTTISSRLFHRIGFFAIRNIYPNEELVLHYGYEFDRDPTRFIECNCGCVGCRTRLR